MFNLKTDLLGILLGAVTLVCVLITGTGSRAARVKRDDELHSIGLSGLHVLGSRFINEHHEVFDYPGDKTKHDTDDYHLGAGEDPDNDKHDDDDDDAKDYHHPIYDHVDVDKDDYSEFGDIDKYEDDDDKHSKKRRKKD